jgi:hypothetical protein
MRKLLQQIILLFLFIGSMWIAFWSIDMFPLLTLWGFATAILSTITALVIEKEYKS